MYKAQCNTSDIHILHIFCLHLLTVNSRNGQGLYFLTFTIWHGNISLETPASPGKTVRINVGNASGYVVSKGNLELKSRTLFQGYHLA